MLIGTFFSCCSFSSENKLGFSILFVHLFAVFGPLFFSFVHSITLKKEEKNLFSPLFCFNSLGKSGLLR